MNHRLPPATLGLIGGGQLGQMIGLSAIATGYRVVVLDPDPHCPAACLADEQIVAPYNDAQALQELNAVCDVITYEFENADALAIAALIPTDKLPQGTHALSVAQHRLREKELALACGIPTPSFVSVTSRAALLELSDFPLILKTCRFGYDGKGQWLIRDVHDLHSLNLDFPGEYIAETQVQFTQEIAVTIARFHDGMSAFDPITTVHENGILRQAIAPAKLSEALRQQAIHNTQRLAEALDYLGVLCVEYFVVDSTLLFNEIAPRPHNSAHATIEGYTLSQYDLHVAAITGSPVLTPLLLQWTYLENLLGQDEPTWRSKVMASPHARLHWYGKREPRSNRKMGHVVLSAPTEDELKQRIDQWRTA